MQRQIVIILVILVYVSGFLPRWIKTNCFTKFCMSSLAYDDDEDINFTYDPEYEDINFTTPLYTLVWYDCVECRDLLDLLSSNKQKIIYINGAYYFYDPDEKGLPLLYKDDMFISDELFEIYAELFR